MNPEPFQIRFWKGEKHLDAYMRILPAKQFNYMLKHRGKICVFGPGIGKVWFKEGEGKEAKKFLSFVVRAFLAGMRTHEKELPYAIRELRELTSNLSAYSKNTRKNRRDISWRMRDS